MLGFFSLGPISIVSALFPGLLFSETSKSQIAPTRGWDDLILCSNLVSLEGEKTLSLSEDHSVIFEDDEVAENNSKENQVTIKGTWSYDENSKEYTVTLGRMTTIYTVMQPKNSPACLFIKGKLEAADLRESWVSANSDDAPEEPPTTP
jgi:hypothetical protein